MPSCLSWRSLGVLRDWLNHFPTSPSVVDPSSLEIFFVCKQPGVKGYYLRFLDWGPEGLAGNVGQARARPQTVPLAIILPFSSWCLHQAYSSRGDGPPLVAALWSLVASLSEWTISVFLSSPLPPPPPFLLHYPCSLPSTKNFSTDSWVLSVSRQPSTLQDLWA